MLSLAETEEWLAANHLNLKEFEYLMSANSRLNFLVIRGNIDILNAAQYPESVWWLQDALWLSGWYSVIKKNEGDQTLWYAKVSDP